MSTDTNTAHTALTAKAITAAVSVASAQGVKIDDPQILANAYSLRVHLRPAPIVARVSTITSLLRPPIESWLAREISVTEFLTSQGAPVVPPSDIMPPIPHHYDGLTMTFWRYVQPISNAVPASDVSGRMLAELHAVLRDYPGDLPLLAPPLNDIPRGLERLEQIGNILNASDIRLLREAFERLLPQISNHSGSLQPLHGDAHALNLISTAEGLLWNDFEDVCFGPTAWDLINFDDEARAAYGDAPEPVILDLYRKVRQIHGIVWVYALLPEFPDWAEPVQALLNDFRDQEGRE